MNHPPRQEWISYLFEETTPVTRRQLDEHLQSCPKCAAEIAGWRRSLKKLDRWQVPSTRPRSIPSAVPLLKWGIAAALLLGAGFGLGRSFAPAADLKIMRTEIEGSVKSALASDLQAALAATRNQITNGFAARLNDAMAGMAEAVALDTRRHLDALIRELGNAREEDRQTLLALFDRIQKQRAADFLSLRGDLETLASMTDAEINRARQSLNQLAVNKTSSKP